MIAALLCILPILLWEEGPATAPELNAAGIHKIAVTHDADAWSSTGITAISIDRSKLTRLDTIGVDYQIGAAGATSAPWVESNLWRMIRNPEQSFVYDVKPAALRLAVAEGYSGGARTFVLVEREHLNEFAAVDRFLRQLDGPPLSPRANFTLVNDNSSEIDEVMNLLVRRNLLFVTAPASAKDGGMDVRIGSPEFPKQSAADPYVFAAIVRSRIGDPNRLVRIYGSETVLVRMYGDEHHARLHLLQYGDHPAQGIRVRVLGSYPRVYLSDFGRNCVRATDVVVENQATEFTIPELRTFAVVDLEARDAGVLHSSWSAHDESPTADPQAEFWRLAPSVSADHDVFGVPAGIAGMEVRSRWTRDFLYLLYICPFERLYMRPQPITNRETPSLWEWDVAEAFIGNDPSRPGQYREFEMSPQSEWVDLDITCSNGSSEDRLEWDSGLQVKSLVDSHRKTWYGEMRIPMTALTASAPTPGQRFSLGLYRTSGPSPDTKLVSWQPIYRRSFHVPESFGLLVLDDNPRQ